MTPLRRCFGALALFLVAMLNAGAADLPKGRLIEKVACAADETQTYALYIPTSFDPAKRWPVVFCFDPGARGAAAAEHFVAAAEKYGYLVVGSNNSRNGPWEANANAINAVFGDVNRFLPVDDKRIYVAGLSGGARVACQVAGSGIASGVIACSAGFIGSTTPDKVKFAFFGTGGVTDFNYLEMRRVDRELEDRKAAHRVVIHGGGHEWLSSDLALEALAWLDLQAMRGGTKPKDAAWIDAQFAARSAAVPAAPLTDRQRALKSLATDFKGLADVAAVEKQAADLAAAKDFKDALKAERALEKREESVAGDLASAIQDGIGGGTRKTAADLRAKAEAKDTPEGQMAFRALQGVYSNCSESSRELLRTEAFDQALPMLELMTVLRPERPQAFFDFARCLARLGEKKRALVALQGAAAAGFKDAARAESEPAFKALRGDPAYAAAVSAMK